MRLGKALATGIAEEAPRDTAQPEATAPERELTLDDAVDATPEPVEVPAAR
ncbi:hypothetical protein [Streptomyces longispororuber]|uniref:hypothetical protein n=1 Tax=Streptomyces longispororuber TaxID=68230 RepID=UPI0021096772|nr:hypothetical protein [Streptomyces longispororuber]MCQ4207310.1 hypothetical protein [Streptomyces longispororuber]